VTMRSRKLKQTMQMIKTKKDSKETPNVYPYFPFQMEKKKKNNLCEKKIATK